MPLEVLCSTCGESYHETTESYNSNVLTNGTMLKLKDKYIAWRWSDFTHDTSVVFDQIVCSGCGAPMAGLSGKVRTRPQNGEVEPAQEPVQKEELNKVPEPLNAVISLKTGEELKLKLSGSWSPNDPAPIVKTADAPAPVQAQPQSTAPMDRLQQFLSANPNDVWEGQECGCEKIRSDFVAEMETCSECCAARDKTAKRKTNTK